MLASVLGCTGSIGLNTINVLEHLDIPIASLAAGKNSVMMEHLARRCKPRLVALFNEEAIDLRVRLADTNIKVLVASRVLLRQRRLRPTYVSIDCRHCRATSYPRSRELTENSFGKQRVPCLRWRNYQKLCKET